jgi:hypothetical protein
MTVLAAILPALLAATIEVAAGTDLSAAMATVRPGDVVRLGPGLHTGSLGRIRGPLRLAGAGAGVTRVVAPEGEDALVIESGAIAITGLSLEAGGPRAALKVLGGEVSADGVALTGGAVGAFVQGGRLDARDADLAGNYGLLLRNGELALTSSRVRGGQAAVAQLGGASELRQVATLGPSNEAGVTISAGKATLEDLVIRDPGPAGLSISHGARVEARGLVVSGAKEESGGFLGDCVQVMRGTLQLEGAALTRCGGAAVEAMGGELRIQGADATGGAAGCLVFIDGARAELDGNRCSGRGPAVVSASGSQVTATMNRWLADPVLWVECGSGARVRLGVGETARQPCQKGGEPLDKPRRP